MEKRIMQKEMDELRKKSDAADKAQIKKLRKLSGKYRASQVSSAEKRVTLRIGYFKKVITGQIPTYHSKKTKGIIYGVVAGVGVTAAAIAIGLSVHTHDYKDAVSFDIATKYNAKNDISKNSEKINTFNAKNIIIVGDVIKKKSEAQIPNEKWSSNEKLVKIGNDPVVEALKGNSNIFEYYFAKTTGSSPNLKQIDDSYSHIVTIDISTGRIVNIKDSNGNIVNDTNSKSAFVISNGEIPTILSGGKLSKSKIAYTEAAEKMEEAIEQLVSNHATTLSKAAFEGLSDKDISLYDKDSVIVANGLVKPSYVNIVADKTDKDSIHYTLSFDRSIFPEFDQVLSFDQKIDSYSKSAEGFGRYGDAATSYSKLNIVAPKNISLPADDEPDDIY